MTRPFLSPNLDCPAAGKGKLRLRGTQPILRNRYSTRDLACLH